METVRVGIIGAGSMGAGHCRSVELVPETTLAAVCDVNEESCKPLCETHNAPFFSDHRELFASGLIDLALIATPHYFHPDIAIDAFGAGLHVLCEKPISVSVSEADRMLEAAQKSGKKFGVMYQMRAEPHFAAAQKLVKEGRLGELYRTLLITAWFRSQAYYLTSDWRATWAGEGGGVLINQAPHLLDLFTLLGGLPSKVNAQTRTRSHEIEVEDEAFALLEYPNGAHGYLYASTTEVPPQTRLELCGDRGKLILTDKTIEFYETTEPIREFSASTPQMWGIPACSKVDLELPPRPDTIRDHAAIIQNMARAILFDEPLIAPGEEGLNAVELICAIQLSGRTGKTVDLPVPRAEYDALLAALKAGSKVKAVSQTVRETDPKFG